VTGLEEIVSQTWEPLWTTLTEARNFSGAASIQKKHAVGEVSVSKQRFSVQPFASVREIAREINL